MSKVSYLRPRCRGTKGLTATFSRSESRAAVRRGAVVAKPSNRPMASAPSDLVGFKGRGPVGLASWHAAHGLHVILLAGGRGSEAPSTRGVGHESKLQSLGISRCQASMPSACALANRSCGATFQRKLQHDRTGNSLVADLQAR